MSINVLHPLFKSMFYITWFSFILGTWVKTRENRLFSLGQNSSPSMVQFDTTLNKEMAKKFRMIRKIMQTSESVTTLLFAPSILALRPRHCYLKYPPNKWSGARDWGKGSKWKRVRASPTYRDSSTFKIHSFPTSNSLEVKQSIWNDDFFYMVSLIQHTLFLIYCIVLSAGP